jgi:hypothetical protein
MPSRKRSRTPPAAPAPAPAAPAKAAARPPARSLQETFNEQHVAGLGLVLVASVPALLLPVTDGPAESSVIAVAAVVLLTLGTLILDRRQWMLEGRRQMLLTLGFGGLAAATVPAVPFGLLLPMLFAAVLEFKRGWGAASALVLGSGVAYAVFGISPVTSYPYVLAMAWPAVGANLMRRISLANSGARETTVLRRGRW